MRHSYHILYNIRISILDSVAPDTAFLIVNALYFKASWAKSFDEGDLQEFTNLDGKREPIRMLKRESKKQAAGRFETELVQGRSNKCITLAIPYEVRNYFFLVFIVFVNRSECFFHCWKILFYSFLVHMYIS